MLDADVIVCGGGPAGLAAAIACAMRDMAVIVLEGRRPPIDKACGEGLLPEALAALDRLGVSPAALSGVPFEGIRFVDGAEAPVEASFRNGCGRGVRRINLHEALRNRAQQAGVDMRWGTVVRGVRQERHGVEVVTPAYLLRAAWCIGADGTASQVRRWAGLSEGKPVSKRIGLRRHYAGARWSHFMEVHWGSGGQVYVTPTAERELCVAAVARERPGSVKEAYSDLPELHDRLRSLECTSTERGAVTCNRCLPCVTAGRVALAGDASGSVDAITGAGLALAFEQSLALSGAIFRQDLNRYERDHKQIRGRAGLLGRLLLQLDRSPALRRIALASFRRHPGLFEEMLAVHTGAAPLSYWGSRGAVRLGLQMMIG